ncbi:MAG: respiratory nitrate reductase subunit gamma [Gemmatimonadetes bacterium]|nr:respiratory nitrate reductase subunit gamma [Gemmatimonadota bacterium]
MSGPILLAVCYGLLAVFVAAFVVRSVRIARLPVHLRWELSPIPKEKTRGRYGGSYLEEYEWWKKPREESLVSELVYMLKEILFLKALWEHNRRLWWFSYPFHVGLYLLVLAAAVFVLGSGAAAVGLTGPEWGILRVWLPVVAGAGYVLGALGALGLLVSRIADPKLRVVSTPVAMFNLALLLAVFVTGAVAVSTVTGVVGHALTFGKALLTAGPMPAMPGILAWHAALTLVFLAYLPFSQMMHFVAKYFTYHEVRWDDEPMKQGGSMEREVQQLLDQPVTWAAPHVGADGGKNWVDIATQEVPR